jgi:uncharacterized protein (TIGR03435 family)
MRTATIVSLIVSGLNCASAQSAAAGPSFEAASVRIAAPAGTAGRITVSGDRAIFTNRTVMQLLNFAYGLGCCDLIRGPSWISTERFDIAAKAPDGTPSDRIPALLQNLLIERFKLALHHETKELPAYDLVTGRGRLKLQKVEGVGVKNDWSLNGERRSAKNMSMGALVVYITQMLRTAVTDKTGLSGYYDFSLDMTKEETLRDSDASIFALLQDLGLDLKAHAAPFDILVIDGGNKVPTED